MEGIALILGKMNALGTSEITVLNASKINTLSSLHVVSHTSCMFSLILLWGEICLSFPLISSLNSSPPVHLTSSLSLSSLQHCYAFYINSK